MRLSGNGKRRKLDTWCAITSVTGFASGELVANLGKKILQTAEELENPVGVCDTDRCDSHWGSAVNATWA